MSTLAVVFFLSHANKSIPTFRILSDRLDWFTIGNVDTIEDRRGLVTAVHIDTKRGATIDRNRSEINSHGIYKIALEVRNLLKR